MKPKPIPVWKLAKEAGVDVDTVLLAIWDFVDVDGRAYDVLNSRNKVPPTLVDPVRKSLGVATYRDLNSIQYWSRMFGMSREDIVEFLETKGYPIRPRKRKLPRGAHKVLKRLAREQKVNPLTGVTSPSTLLQPESVQGCDADIPPPPSFHNLGRHRDLRWLTVEEVLSIHDSLVDDFARKDDPIDPPGVRDEHIIESAVFRPHIGMQGTLKYPTVETSAAALLYALIHDHPFHNGNKRTALVSTLVFLDENGLVLTCSEDELFRFVLLIAKHKISENRRYHFSDYETQAIARQIVKWSRVVRKGEHPMTFLKLRPILEELGCKISIKNSQAVIRRNAEHSSRILFSRKRIKQFTSYVTYRDEGTDIPPIFVKKIRKDLRLDHEHGYDESNFYSKNPSKIDDFIAKYRKTLLRLAKL